MTEAKRETNQIVLMLVILLFSCANADEANDISNWKKDITRVEVNYHKKGKWFPATYRGDSDPKPNSNRPGFIAVEYDDRRGLNKAGRYYACRNVKRLLRLMDLTDPVTRQLEAERVMKNKLAKEKSLVQRLHEMECEMIKTRQQLKNAEDYEKQTSQLKKGKQVQADLITEKKREANDLELLLHQKKQEHSEKVKKIDRAIAEAAAENTRKKNAAQGPYPKRNGRKEYDNSKPCQQCSKIIKSTKSYGSSGRHHCRRCDMFICSDKSCYSKNKTNAKWGEMKKEVTVCLKCYDDVLRENTEAETKRKEAEEAAEKKIKEAAEIMEREDAESRARFAETQKFLEESKIKNADKTIGNDVTFNNTDANGTVLYGTGNADLRRRRRLTALEKLQREIAEAEAESE